MRVIIKNMKIDINQMSEDEFRTFLRTTEEGKLLKKIAMESYKKTQEKKKSKKNN